MPAVKGVEGTATFDQKKMTLLPTSGTLKGEKVMGGTIVITDLDVIDQSLRANGSGVLADDRLARLREAVHVFGFHLSGLDLRQNSDVHEAVVAELLQKAGVHADYAGLDEPARIELLIRELGQARLLFSPYVEYSERTISEHRILEAAAEAHAAFGPECIRAYIVSKTGSVSDLLEVYLLLKEVGLFKPGPSPTAAVYAVPALWSGPRRRKVSPIAPIRPGRGRPPE